MEWFRERFAIAPCKILSAEIVTAVEERHLVRVEVRSILRHAKSLPRNSQKDDFSALIVLKKDPDRLVFSADKGNCVMVMDKQQYRDKALSLLDDKSTHVQSTK